MLYRFWWFLIWLPSAARCVCSFSPTKWRKELNDRQSTSTVTGWWRNSCPFVAWEPVRQPCMELLLWAARQPCAFACIDIRNARRAKAAASRGVTWDWVFMTNASLGESTIVSYLSLGPIISPPFGGYHRASARFYS